MARAPGAAQLGQVDGLIQRRQWAQARQLLERLVAREPGNREAWMKLRVVAANQGDWSELRRVTLPLLGLEPPGPQRDDEEAHLCLLYGDMPRGWDLYEARLRIPGRPAVYNWSKPDWDGAPFPGRTLVIYWEQGFGDTLMFVRYAALAKARGGRVVLLVQRELADLVATCPGVDLVVPNLDPIPPHDFTVPHLFRTDLASIPAPVPYLRVPATVPHRQGLDQALAVGAGRRRIGIQWAGSPTHLRDRERSLALGALAPLASLPGVAWYSFQLGAKEAPPLPGLVHLGPLMGNFSDTAHALLAMDRVITVDTALAHLAGALGIPTLVLLPIVPDFRWMLGRSDSPWYPGMRLYRQSASDAWPPVVAKVLADLRAWLRAPAPCFPPL